MFFGMAGRANPMVAIDEVDRAQRERPLESWTVDDYDRAIDSVFGPPTPSPFPLNRADVQRRILELLQLDQSRGNTLNRWRAPALPRELVPEWMPDQSPASTSRPPVLSTRTISTQDDPRLAGINATVAAMYADPRVTASQISEYLGQFGINSDEIDGWQAAMNFRRTRDFRRWASAPPETRQPHMVNLDDIHLSDPQTIAVRETPTFTGELRAYRPSAIVDPISRGYGRLSEALGGDRYTRQRAEANMRSFLENPLCPVESVEAAIEADQRGREAAARGEFGTSLREQSAVFANSVAAIPIVGRARTGIELGGRGLARIETLAGRRLGRNHANHSWESAPGRSSGHLADFEHLHWQVRQDYHDDVRNVFLDGNGQSRIAAGYGRRPASSFDGAGIYEGAISPSTHDRILVSTVPRGQELDAPSRAGMDAIASTHGLLGAQDAGAWNYLGHRAVPPAEANAVDFYLGRAADLPQAERLSRRIQRAYPNGNVVTTPSQRGFRLFDVERDPAAPPLNEFVDELRRSDPDIRRAPAFWTRGSSSLIQNDWDSSGRFGADYVRHLDGSRLPALVDRFNGFAPEIAKKMLYLDRRIAFRHGLRSSEQVELVRRTILDQGWEGLTELVRRGAVSRSVLPLLVGMAGLSTFDELGVDDESP